MPSTTTIMGSASNAPRSSATHPPLTFSFSMTPVGTNYSRSPNREHRRLDRSASEPVAQQLRPATAATPINHSSRYKTELCRPFEENGDCKYGDKCQFAHGFSELRNLTRHPKYKTELCRTFHSTGFCPYGPRCHFIHNDFSRNPINSLQQSGNINIPSSNIKSLLETTRGVPFVDVTLKNFSPVSVGSAGDISPHSSSISGSPVSCSGFALLENDDMGVFSPLPQTTPAFITKNAFFGQDFVPFPSVMHSAAPQSQQISPSLLQRLMACTSQSNLQPSKETSLDTAMGELSLVARRCNSASSRPTPMNNDNSKIRLPIFNQLAFPPSRYNGQH